MGTADGRFGREVIRDFGWRAAHLMTVQSKRMVAAYYGRPARKNYFFGISSGGGQGLHEAQRFPEDYDGIVSYVPAHYRTRLAEIGRAKFRNGTKRDAKGFMNKALAGADAPNEYDMNDDDFKAFVETIRDYCEALVKRYGGIKGVDSFFRAYFLPGRGHTRAKREDGVEDIPSHSAMIDWVERGIAPEALEGTQKNGARRSVEPWRGTR